MNKMNRDIDQSKFDIIKERSIDNVLDSIHETKHSLFTRKKLSLVLMILLVALTVPFAMKLDNSFVPVDANIDEELLSTLAYVSTSMLNEEIALSNTYNITFLADEDETLIESELDDINIYFDKLKYLDRKSVV